MGTGVPNTAHGREAIAAFVEFAVTTEILFARLKVLESQTVFRGGASRRIGLENSARGDNRGNRYRIWRIIQNIAGIDLIPAITCFGGITGPLVVVSAVIRIIFGIAFLINICCCGSAAGRNSRFG